MIGNTMQCARTECGAAFVKTTHNQKYCTNDCCRIETNRKIMVKYHEKVAIRKGKKRSCATCGTSLSRYNENKDCSACESKRRKSNVGEAARLVSAVSWL